MGEFDDFIANTQTSAKARCDLLATPHVALLQRTVLPILEEAADSCRRQKIGFRLILRWLKSAANYEERIEFSCTELVRSEIREGSKYIFGPLLQFSVEKGPGGIPSIMGRTLNIGDEHANPSYVSEPEIRELVKLTISEFLFKKERFLRGVD